MKDLVDKKDRERIRTALDRNLVVEAAAGTGKTTELVNRIVTVLAAGRSTVDRIVAVTFTEKAAGELKLRLRAGLEEARQALQAAGSARPPAGGARRQASDPGRRAHLEDALARLEEARVGTIHSFCADLLRERSVEAGIDPLFETLSEPEAERLWRRAFDSWLQEKLEHPPEGVRRSLRRTARTWTPSWMQDRSGSYPAIATAAPAEGPIGRLRQAGWTLAEWRDFPAEWRRDPFDRRARLDALVQQLHAVADLTARCSNPERDPLFLDTQPLRRSSATIHASEQVRPRDDDGLEALCVDLAARRRERSRQGWGKRYGEGLPRDEVVRARDELLRALEEFARDADADLAARLRSELGEAVERYARLKQRTGRLDFVDLLIRARDLIRDCAAVRREFQARFTHLFVDEFQDTDPLQAEILLLLAAGDPEVTDWREVHPAPGKLFLVADPKQSIYRFRRADIGTYLEVKELLAKRGALCLHLTTSFRAVPNIQHVVNAAFARFLDGNRAAQQAPYVPLAPWRVAGGEQASVVVLPVPRPYGTRQIAKWAIDESLPDAVAAFVDWLLHESGWTVSARESPERRAPVTARDVCILLRRFDSFYAGDVTRGYVRALEARDIRHLLVGGRSFHEREEVETLRTALTAIEWPDDELSVFATLHGSLFAIGDEELLEYGQRFGRLHPFRIPEELRGEETGQDLPTGVTPGQQQAGSALHRTHAPASSSSASADSFDASARPALEPDARTRLEPIATGLELLAALHRRRNARPIAETIHLALEATRSHAAFVLRPSGEQALANVLHIAEQARGYEREGGISFRGFVELLEEEALGRKASEAPILEEGSDGVRIMTVHKAKGLEFPVVVLADITANLAFEQATRWIDPARRLCAQRLAGWSPAELLEHQAEEKQRDAAEGVRIAYVAATRARDLLVIPAVGDGPHGGGWRAPVESVEPDAQELAVGPPGTTGPTGPTAPTAPTGPTGPTGWIAPLNAAIYPPPEMWSQAKPAPGCPRFGVDSVLDRPFDVALGAQSVRPGLHVLSAPEPQHTAIEGSRAVPDSNGPLYDVVWWDPSRLRLDVPPNFGIRQEELLGKEADPAVVAADVASYRSWELGRAAEIERASTPARKIRTATEQARLLETQGAGSEPTAAVEVVRLQGGAERPGGPRFGALVHAVLATVALDAALALVERSVELQARILGATPGERTAARGLVANVLRHPLLERARRAAASGQCRRETPVTWRDADGTLVEGVVDLAFREGDTWTVVDFKTDRELEQQLAVYTHQVGIYARAVAAATGLRAAAILMQI